MCGICGFAGAGNRDDIRAMARGLIHRGPDDEGFFHHQPTNTWLGHRRLSIIDLSRGTQPMASPDGRHVIVFNGEIYNHQNLRTELETLGHAFQTSHSDTETILVGYAAWGPDVIDRLNGMWALAILDQRDKTLFLSRDRFGKKPLFYYSGPDRFIFASELSALPAHSGLNPSLSPLSLKKYFAYGFIPGANSLYQGVNKLPAGHNLHVNLEDLRGQVKKYWSFTLEPRPGRVDRARVGSWCEELRELLQKAVTRRLMSDVPLGVFLSGGIDSTAVSALAARALPPGTLKTFSLGFEEPSFDESGWAALAAERLKTEHHLEKLSLHRARELAPSVVSSLDEPFGDSSILPTWLLSRITRGHVTVALGGDGGDELFAGYDPFKALFLADLYQKIVPRPVHRGICLAVARLPVSHANMSLDFKLKRTLRGLSHPKRLRNPVWLGPLAPGDLEDLFGAPMDEEEVYEEAIAAWDDCRGCSSVDQTLMFYTRLYLTDDILVKADRAGMLNSLEVRAPFLDLEVAEFARRLPASVKYRRGTTKWILKKALAPLLPAEILNRPKKGFGIPIGRWLQNGVLSFDFNRPIPGLNDAFCRDKLAEHRAGKADHRAFLWNLWALGVHTGGGA